MMKGNDGIHSLLAWCIDKELEAHINAVKHYGLTKGLEWEAREKAFREMMEKIQNMRSNQRPHVKEV